MQHNDQSQEQEYILADDLSTIPQLTEATKWQRFFNWFIDNLLMRFTITYVSARVVWELLYALSEDLYMTIVYSDSLIGRYVFAYTVVIFSYLFYYTFCEKLFRGYTLGKLLTGTRAIRSDGGELTLKDAILRSLIRLIPFEVLSGFGYEPWHDAWTNTTVIRAR